MVPWLAVVLVAGALLPSGARADPDGYVLPALLARTGFVPPDGFKALVVLPDEAGVGPSFDWCGTSDDRDDWWPASSVKLFAAIAALERSRALGYPPDVWVRYHYDRVPGADPDAGSRAWRLSGMIRRAIAPSSNPDFDRLVELVGFDAIHRTFFTAENGLTDTVFRRAYTGRLRDPESDVGIFRDSPPISLYLGRRRTDLPARAGTLDPSCPDLGNCTTLQDLVEALRRVAFHERLPEAERFDLGPDEVALLREALGAPRPRGNGLPEAVARGFGRTPAGLSILHKPGYALRWISDVMLVERPEDGRRFLLAAAARPGRRALDDALERLGRLLAGGDLDGVESTREMLEREGRARCRRGQGR